MATALAVGTEYAFPNGSDSTQRRKIHYGSLAISVSPATYLAGGLVFSFTAPIFGVSTQTPITMQVYSISGSGYTYEYVPSTGKIKVFTGSAAQAPATELTTAAAIPAGVSGDVIEFKAEFLKGGV